MRADRGSEEGLIQEAYKKFQDKNVAIFYRWYEGSQLVFTCIGALCDRMTPQARQKQACMQGKVLTAMHKKSTQVKAQALQRVPGRPPLLLRLYLHLHPHLVAVRSVSL